MAVWRCCVRLRLHGHLRASAGWSESLVRLPRGLPPAGPHQTSPSGALEALVRGVTGRFPVRPLASEAPIGR
eukprot:3551976-Alexandrium_andersonii.AAC.1